MTEPIQRNQPHQDLKVGKGQAFVADAATKGVETAKRAIGKELSGKGKSKAPQDTGGITFAEGTLKDIKVKEERVKDKDGVFETRKVYTATLTDGTVVTYTKQPDGGKGGIDTNTAPRIVKNKDGSIDFIGINDAEIHDTPKDDVYNLLGCSFTGVHLNDNKKDTDTVNTANIKDSNGKIVKNYNVYIDYNKGDKIVSPKSDFAHTQDYNGYMKVFGDSTVNFDEVENGRTRKTIDDEKDGVSVSYRSHDNKKLKETYVHAKEQVLADGYKIKTSSDGKDQWFYTPDGKIITKNEFKNRGLQ